MTEQLSDATLHAVETAVLPDSPGPIPTKRRAFSVGERVPSLPIPRRRAGSSSASPPPPPTAPASGPSKARRAVSSAFGRLIKSRSLSDVTSSSDAKDGDPDHVRDRPAPVAEEASGELEADGQDVSASLDADADTGTPPLPAPGRRGRSFTMGSSSWRLADRIKQTRLPAMPAPLRAFRRQAAQGVRFPSRAAPWKHGHVQYVASRFALHGEDVGAVSSYYHIVADGVSASAQQQHQSAPESTAPHVSSEALARELVQSVEAALEDLSSRNKAPLDVTQFEQLITDAIRATRIKCYAYRASRVASTLCVAYFDRWNSKLHCFTLGDSKCLVVRRGDVVFESTATVREFNVPCVVNLVHQLVPSDYVVETVDLRQDDVCLTFSDGVGDNVYRDDVLDALLALDVDGREPAAPAPSLQEVCDRLVDMCAVKEPTATPSADAAEVIADVNDEDDNENENDGHAMPAQPDAQEQETQSAAPELAELVEPELTPTSCRAAPMEAPLAKPTADSVRFYPFATAAAYEYRRRVLKQRGAGQDPATDETFAEHVRASAALLELHDGKSVLDRQVVVAKANRKPHYSLEQLQRMARLCARKPDDVTLFITRFRMNS
ncbi:hypothetical protein ATCC90586_003546 [Pythium insidiosum]|nr:hypothetical protein ATCC90586_003546 [Pythium insidiosum]